MSFTVLITLRYYVISLQHTLYHTFLFHPFLFHSLVFIISTLISGMFYCLNYTSLLLHLIITHIVIDFKIITISISLAISISVLFISLLQLRNGAQSLNIRPLFLSSSCLAATAPAPVIVTLPLTSMYASLWSHKYFLIDHLFQSSFLF